MKHIVTLSLLALLAAASLTSCMPTARAQSGGTGNGYPLEATACWGGDGSGNFGFWLLNWGDGDVTVRNDLSRIIYPDGSEHQAVSEMDLRRYRETQTFQKTLTIGSNQQALVGMVSTTAMRFDERVGGWVYSVPNGSNLVLIVDTPNGRVYYDTGEC